MLLILALIFGGEAKQVPCGNDNKKDKDKDKDKGKGEGEGRGKGKGRGKRGSRGEVRAKASELNLAYSGRTAWGSALRFFSSFRASGWALK